MRSQRTAAALLVLLAAGAAALASWQGRSHPPQAAGEARRIVTASPALAEGLFAIGAGDRVVGVSRFCEFPPAVKALPQVGGILDPNLLAIEGLHPDCLLVQGSAGTNVRVETFARERGIRVERFSIETIADVLAAFGRLGELTGHGVEAAREVARLTSAVAVVRGRAPRRRPRVLLSIERTAGEIREVATAGKESFVVECLEAAGGETIFPDFARGYRGMSKEAAAERKPEAIVELRTEPTPPELETALRRDWQAALPDSPAVVGGHVYVVEDDAALIPGPRLDRVIERIARVVREAAGEPR